MPCAPGTKWLQVIESCVADDSNVKTTKSTITNPCTKENIDAGRFYFAYSNENFFIHCNKWGAYCVMPCAPGTKWLQVIESCVADDSNVKTTTTTKYDITNPCTKENIKAGRIIFPHPNKNYVIRCDLWGNYYEIPCAPGTQWSQSDYTCI
ncbi:uncharacterized protein LOC118763085 [Octopus sinensis]|uniref:Uncharacterized protein LOC118763085 n=1 Tax=Octopus sinensis TaxID=2607531 RepID=A0A7E6EU32_9MOLL|nr:uncharacterized protein LOC118763085 [Octopus sinensis]